MLLDSIESKNKYIPNLRAMLLNLNNNLEFHVRITSYYGGMHLKVVDANKGGIVAIVEGLRGFVPFSQISTVS